MTDLNLQPLLGRIVSNDGLPPLREDSEAGIVSHPTSYERPFISPTVVLAAESGDAHAPVILVSASAAVGKSRLAQYLAATTGNPIWDLSAPDTKPGTHFFSGTLDDAYGDAGFIEMKQRIRSRRVTIVVDALDEALVHTGIDVHMQAIASLAALASQCEDGETAPFVLLGRNESLDYIAVALSERGVEWQRMHIEFFSAAERRSFVHTIAESVSDRLASSEEIDRFIDVVFGVVEAGIRESSSVPSEDILDSRDMESLHQAELDSFLGYAPVLDALARLASQQDSGSAIFSDRPQKRDLIVWELLADVMGKILEREVDKISQQNNSMRDLYNQVFGPSRQIGLLFANFAAFDVKVPLHLPQDEATQIRKRVEAQFRDHPFSKTGFMTQTNPLERFKNPAFRDYCLARVMAGDLGDGSLDSTDVALSLMQYEYVPSPLFVRLLVAVAGDKEVPMTSLGYMLDSAGTQLGSRLLESTVTVIETSDSDAILDFSLLEDQAPIGSCRVSGSRSDLILTSRLAYCAVYLGGLDVKFASSYEFAIGPDVFLECEALISATYSIRVESSVGQDDDTNTSRRSIIRARRVSGSTRSITATPDQFEVQVISDVIYPWSVFRSEWVEFDWSYSDYYSAAMGLRRLSSWFLRSSMVGRQTYPASRFDTILSKGRAPRDWFDFLLSNGNLTRRQTVYDLDLGSVPMTAVRQVDLSNEALRSLLSSFLAARRW